MSLRLKAAIGGDVDQRHVALVEQALGTIDTAEHEGRAQPASIYRRSDAPPDGRL
jgi:hypothetical protein